MNHNHDCPCATDSVPHGAGCADCSCPQMSNKKICPTCEGEVKFDIIDGKCKACRLGVIPDWAKPGVTVSTKTDPKTGLDIPACSACGQTLSSIPRGKATEAELEQTASRWAIHVLEKHPEEAGRIVREKGGHR